MADDRVTETPHTTVIEKSGGGGAGIFIGIILLIAVVIGGFYLMNQSKNDNIKTDAVTSAAKDVGDSAKKVGDTAEKAAGTQPLVLSLSSTVLPATGEERLSAQREKFRRHPSGRRCGPRRHVRVMALPWRRVNPLAPITARFLGSGRTAARRPASAGVMLRRVVAEIADRAGVHAIGADPRLGDVEIDLHDPPLAPDRLDQDGEIGLQRLARIAAALDQEDVLGGLLADRRAAADAAAACVAGIGLGDAR